VGKVERDEVGMEQRSSRQNAEEDEHSIDTLVGMARVIAMQKDQARLTPPSRPWPLIQRVNQGVAQVWLDCMDVRHSSTVCKMGWVHPVIGYEAERCRRIGQKWPFCEAFAGLVDRVFEPTPLWLHLEDSL